MSLEHSPVRQGKEAASAELSPDGYLLEELGYLDESEAAAAIGLTPQTLTHYRKLGKGPAHAVVGRRILYSRDGIGEWLASGGSRETE